MFERRRNLTNRAFLAIAAAVAMFFAMLLVWMAFAAVAGNVDVAYGLGTNEQIVAWLEPVPATLFTGVIVGLVARLRGRSFVWPAPTSTALAAVVPGAYQIASIGRTSIEQTGEPMPVYRSPPAWLPLFAISGGALLEILAADTAHHRESSNSPQKESISS